MSGYVIPLGVSFLNCKMEIRASVPGVVWINETMSIKKKRERDGVENVSEEGNRYPGAGSIGSSKQDELEQTHIKTYHN